jgi:hypothetical protein
MLPPPRDGRNPSSWGGPISGSCADTAATKLLTRDDARPIAANACSGVTTTDHTQVDVTDILIVDGDDAGRTGKVPAVRGYNATTPTPATRPARLISGAARGLL